MINSLIDYLNQLDADQPQFKGPQGNSQQADQNLLGMQDSLNQGSHAHDFGNGFMQMAMQLAQPAEIPRMNMPQQKEEDPKKYQGIIGKAFDTYIGGLLGGL